MQSIALKIKRILIKLNNGAKMNKSAENPATNHTLVR